ncbi:hypothetical protein DPMN_187677 [Dreissena polymorpha]|uniref:Uncharacterized protein n=2 Tax=Dreissena polymorpha TaxID=45954 RepID=A0A9D4DHF3_DREPO|nr:hypothetical protein DPMN_183006 [Dreissena polymorpha]KAH3753047.1 hypothetical protein DPMN_187677 [Dreissena polymorpha]
MENNDLLRVLPGDVTAWDIAMLIRMKKESPDTFYKYIQEVLKVVKLSSMSRLIWALEDVNHYL